MKEDPLLIPFAKLTIDLMNLLGVRFDVPPYDETVIGKTLKMILEYHFAGHHEKRDLQIYRMRLLCDQIVTIINWDRHLLAKFKDDLLAIGEESQSDYFGARFEVNIAAILIDKGLNFVKPEDYPDFLVNYQSNQIGIECTSVRLSQVKSGKNYFYKILSALNEKSNKPYANLMTAIFIDITNAFATSIRAGTHNDWIPTHEELIQLVTNRKFGTVFLFSYLAPDDKPYMPVYQRFDHPNIDNSLYSFLQAYFPYGKTTIKKISITGEG